jgi:hypothetical protein
MGGTVGPGNEHLSGRLQYEYEQCLFLYLLCNKCLVVAGRRGEEGGGVGGGEGGGEGGGILPGKALFNSVFSQSLLTK